MELRYQFLGRSRIVLLLKSFIKFSVFVVFVFAYLPALATTTITEYPATEQFGDWHYLSRSMPPSGTGAIDYWHQVYPNHSDMYLTPASCTVENQALVINCSVTSCRGSLGCHRDVERTCNGNDELFQKEDGSYWCRKINYKDPDCRDRAGNPCQVSTGAKFLNETDISSGSMTFTRNYHSLNLTDKGLGKGWHNPYFKGLTVSEDSLSLGSGTGRGEPWRKLDGVWQGDADSDYLVAETATDGFTVTDSHDNVSEYDSAGRLLSETDAQGRSQTYAYDAENRLISVTNHYGMSLSFAYSTDGKNHVTQVTEANGVVYRYEYDSNDNLVAVIYPDNTPDDSDNPRRVYHYENNDFPNHLTGITNTRGERYATYAYDSEGKAILTEHAQTTNSVGQERFQLSY